MTTITPPQPVAPSPLTPGGRKAVRAALVVAASALVIGCLVALAVTAWGLSAVRVVAEGQALPGDMRSLVIDTGSAPLAVRLTTDPDAAEPRVSMRIVNVPRAGGQNLVVTREAGNTRLTVNGEGSRFMDWGRTGELTVTLPTQLARALSVTVQQDDGVLLAQADLARLTARNTDGAVMLSGAVRSVDVRTQDGNIVAREPISVAESFDVRTVDGNVAVDFAGPAPRTIDVTTADGDITISLPEPGPYLVRASADPSHVRVPETTDSARAAAEVTLRSTDGDVTVDTR